MNRLAKLLAFEVAARVPGCVGERPRRGARTRFVQGGEMGRLTDLAPSLAAAGVAGNGVRPGREGRLPAEAGEVLRHRGHDVLQDLLGVLGVAAEDPAVAVGRSRDTFQNSSQSRPIPRARRSQELGLLGPRKSLRARSSELLVLEGLASPGESFLRTLSPTLRNWQSTSKVQVTMRRSNDLRVPKRPLARPAARRLPAARTILALLSVGVLPTLGCASHEARPASSAVAETVSVRTTLPGADETWASLVVPGRVKAREEVTLTARIEARLTELPRREGDTFRAGEVLARFDAPETRDALRSARQALHAAEARRNQAAADEARAQALFERRVIAARDLELAQLELASAEAGEADARAEVQRWEESTALTAPFAGVIARRHVDPGRTVAPGEALLDLRSSATGEIEAAIPESALPVLAGAVFRYQFAEGDWRPARLARVDGMTDYTTRTRRAYLLPDDAADLEPGSFVRVRLVRERRGEDASTSRTQHDQPAALAVPADALVHRGALTGVYVVRDDRAWLRWLRVGRASEGSVEVLAGLSPDEPIVLEPAAVSDGQPVRSAP